MIHYPICERYDPDKIAKYLRGPNPMKLAEELLSGQKPEAGSIVLDLCCGHGITSVMLAKDFGYRVFATDLWIPPTENKKLFDSFGITRQQIVPLQADPHHLPFAEEFFDAIISVDMFPYYNSNPDFIKNHFLPYIRHGGSLMLAFPGLKREFSDRFPPEMLLSWTEHEHRSFHSVDRWKALMSKVDGLVDISVREMESFDECWNDWLSCDNEFVRNDLRSMKAGAGKYMNFIAVTAKRK